MRLVATLLTLAAAPMAMAESMTYTAKVSGARIGTITMNGEANSSSYAVSGQLSGSGVLGAIFDISYNGTASGSRAGEAFRPAKTDFTSGSRGDVTNTAIRWNGTTVASATRGDGEQASNLGAYSGALDPLSATYFLARTQPKASVCNDRMKVFDGKRAVDIVIGAPTATANGVTCNARWTRQEDENLGKVMERSGSFTLTYTGGDQVSLQRIDVPSPVGRAVISR
ncbi:DUF3108 domain-containing protein [Paracoccaceae bacterium GXU_MW_L88]